MDFFNSLQQIYNVQQLSMTISILSRHTAMENGHQYCPNLISILWRWLLLGIYTSLYDVEDLQHKHF